MINQETLKTFDELYYVTYQDILKYVVINCSNIEDVKDIVQNVYLDVLKKIDKNKTLISKAYVIGIAKNKVKDYYRFNYKNKLMSLFSSSNKTEIELIDTIEASINLEEELLKEENINFIWTYLKKQDVIISKIFYLYYYMDYNIKDIAKVLSISESNVKNYLYRTLKKINALMKRSEESV